MNVDKLKELAAELREYAGNSGYSHNDYADVMRQAADALTAQPVQPSNEEALRKALERLHNLEMLASEHIKKLDDEARASRSFENARDNFHDPKPNALAYEKAAIAACVASNALRSALTSAPEVKLSAQVDEKDKRIADLEARLDETYKTLQQFKQRWTSKPRLTKLNAKELQAISEAISPIVNLDAVGRPLDGRITTFNPNNAASNVQNRIFTAPAKEGKQS
jgi:uncharacterized iron-regulated protein